MSAADTKAREVIVMQAAADKMAWRLAQLRRKIRLAHAEAMKAIMSEKRRAW